MWKLEFQPLFFSTERLILTILFFSISIFLSTIALPKIFAVPNLPNNQPDVFRIVLISSLATGIAWIVIVPAVIQMRGKRIWIENDLIYFVNKPVIGKIASNPIQLSQIQLIEGRRDKLKFLPIPIPIIFHHLNFTLKNGQNELVPLSGWDNATLKCVLFYIKGRYPNVVMNTHVYKDPPEYLAGLGELVSQKQQPKPQPASN